MGKYNSAVEDSTGRVHATESIVHISPACGYKVYIGTGRELYDVDCPDCQRLMAEDKAASVLAAATEQSFGVWLFTGTDGMRHWVAAKSEGIAAAHLLKWRSQTVLRSPGVQVMDLDEDGFYYGDVEEGEEQTPCTLRELVAHCMSPGQAETSIIAEDNY